MIPGSPLLKICWPVGGAFGIVPFTRCKSIVHRDIDPECDEQTSDYVHDTSAKKVSSFRNFPIHDRRDDRNGTHNGCAEEQHKEDRIHNGFVDGLHSGRRLCRRLAIEGMHDAEGERIEQAGHDSTADRR